MEHNAANANQKGKMPAHGSYPEEVDDPVWHSSLFDLDSLCLKACVCPCIVYGQTQYRLGQRAQHKDATDLSGYSTFNGSCGCMALLCGSQAILAILERMRVRETYQINGNLGKDIFTGFCCLANSLAQNDREVVKREAKQQHTAGNVSNVGYTRPGEMQYAAPT